MHLRHRLTATVVACTAGLVLASGAAGPASAAARVAPKAGTLYVGTATEDGAPAGAVSVRVGPGGTSLVSLLGGSFHGDLCAQGTPLFAGPGGIDPAAVTLAADGRFDGAQVTAGVDGARIAGQLHGRFSANATGATGTLTYSDAPVSGVTPCTVTAVLALHLAPATPGGKVTPARRGAAYQVITHQGWTSTIVTDKKAATAALQLGAWDVCHYVAVPAVHFLYPEHLLATTAIRHGRLSVHLRYAGGSGSVDATVTGAFVGGTHQLAGALHVRRSGLSNGNAFSCDTQRVLFSAP